MSGSSAPLAAPLPHAARVPRRAGAAAALVCLLAAGLALLVGSGRGAPATLARASRSADMDTVHAADTPRGLSALPVAARLAVSRGLGGDLAQFALARAGGVAGTYHARNAANGFVARFGERGVTVTTARHARLALALRAIGFAGALQGVALDVAPRVRSNRVEYSRGAASE